MGWASFMPWSTTHVFSPPPPGKIMESSATLDMDITSRLLELPQEIIHQILSHITDCRDLNYISQTCRILYSAAHDDRLWMDLLHQHIPPSDYPTTSPYPSPTYRDLYITHHPYWFLTRHRLWISNESAIGRIILARYDPRRGCIEGYRLLATPGPDTPDTLGTLWPYNPNVFIHEFHPRVHLWLDDPVLKLPHSAVPFTSHLGWWESEIKMSVGRPGHNTSASFFLARNLPDSALHPSVAVWPPFTIPSQPRIRSSSRDKFQGRGHKPQTHDEISQTAFRMRHWSQFSANLSHLGVRIGEEVSSWCTLDEQVYKPTKEKPWQGIFVGDYAGHGCEFLVVMQTERAPAAPQRTGREYFSEVWEATAEENLTEEGEGDAMSTSPSDASSSSSSSPSSSSLPPPQPSSVPTIQQLLPHSSLPPSPPPPPSSPTLSPTNTIPSNPIDPQFHGAIEAVKLTGDPNVPRGEHTFIADDIGPRGLIRIATEEPFRGARVVRSRGHVAGRGFQHDEYIPSQLIMVNHDVLAQYWVPFGHISIYRRVDLDGLMRRTFGAGET